MAKKSKRQRSALIYLLVDPRNPFVARYVGRSVNGLARPRQHLYPKDIERTHVKNWVRSLAHDSVQPMIIVAEHVDWNEDSVQLNEILNQREVFWIAKLRSEGHPLTNMTDGGFGVIGMTEESKRKIGDANRGPRGPQKCGRRHPLFGKKLPERIVSMRRGKKQAEETIQKRVAHLKKAVECLNDGRTFPSAKDAAVKLGVKYETLKVAASRETPMRNGLHVRYL